MCSELLDGTGADDVSAASAVLADNDIPVAVRALNPAYGSSTTASDSTRLLTLLWRGELASGTATEFGRRG
jgi:beta-lactamase class A